MVASMAALCVAPWCSGQVSRAHDGSMSSGTSSLWVVSSTADDASAIRDALLDRGAVVIAHLGPLRWLVAGEEAAVSSVQGLAPAVPWRPAQADRREEG